MRWRLLLEIPTVGLAVASVSCPAGDVVVAEPEPARPALARGSTPSLPAAPAPGSSAPPPPSSAPVDPAMLTTLPPELVDDGSDEIVDPEPAPPPKANAREVPELASTAKETWVFAAPNWKARRIGYLRAGSIVARRAEPAAKNRSCPDGWYRIEPHGYVCVGQTATLDVFDAVVETSSKRPRHDGLPYTYVMSRFPPPPFYARLPSAEETRKVEPDLEKHLRSAARWAKEPGFVEPPAGESVPGVLLYGRAAPALGGEGRAPGALSIGHARARSGFALLSTFDHEGRRYGLTTELTVLPIDRTRVIKPSAFRGIKLDDEVTLPVAFVRSRHATRWVAGPGGTVARGAPLGYREAVPIVGASSRGGAAYLVAKDGSLILSEQAVRVDRFQHAPAWATGERRWIDISILRQSLVAYEGKKPVYVTLVSTGADGIGDPKETRSTIQGAFLIHTKHVSATMDDDKVGDEFDLRDVPFVQYFTEGFALHGAYWHDDFGRPRSHGCVNLAPVDAAWLFGWTSPEVPEGWHAALSLRKGTLVYTHP